LWDYTIKLWRVSDGALLRTLEGHTGGVTSVAFSPDGSMIASGSGDGTIKLWRVSDGALLKTYDEETVNVYPVAFSPDGLLLAWARADATVVVAKSLTARGRFCTLVVNGGTGSGRYPFGSSVEISAYVPANYRFWRWDGDVYGVANVRSARTKVSLIRDQTVTALLRLLGDVDNNGVVTTEDAVRALDFALGLAVPSEGEVLAADLDLDGVVEREEAEKILRMASASSSTFREWLPVRVIGRVFYVVPVKSLPPVTRDKLLGKTDLAVLDSQGRVVGNADIAHSALIGWYVAKNLLDDPKNPGWDVGRAQELARMFEQKAKDLKHFRRLGMVMTPLGWIRNVAFGSLVTVGFAYVSGASGAVVAKDVFLNALKKITVDPKHIARTLLDADMLTMEQELSDVAKLVRRVKHPLGCEDAARLLWDYVAVATAADAACDKRLAVEGGELPEQIQEIVKTVAFSFLESAVPAWYGKGSDYVTITKDLKSLDLLIGMARQIHEYWEYDQAKNEAVGNYLALIDFYRRRAEAIAAVGRGG
jgi:hypothetical protein